MRFRYETDGPFRKRVLLDDYNASNALQGFTLRSTVRDVDMVTLDLTLFHEERVDTDAVVVLPAAVVDLLTHHGWTPPEGASVRHGVMELKRQDVEPDQPMLPEVVCICIHDVRSTGHEPACPIMGE